MVILFNKACPAQLIDVLNTLQVYDLHRPPYVSVIMIELHQELPRSNFFVEVHYRNDTTREPYKLTMPFCGAFRCPLKKFLDYCGPLIPGDWDAECLTIETPKIISERWSTFTCKISN